MTLAEIRELLQALGYGTDTATQQNLFINAAYRRLAGQRRWSWLETDDAETLTVAGTQEYSLAGLSIQGIDAVRLETSALNDTYDLDWLEAQDLRNRAQVDQINGRPEFWTQWAQTLLLYPRPDREYTVRIDYIALPADLVDDASTPVFPEQYHDILAWGAASYIAFRERDGGGKQMADAEWGSRLMEMQRALGIKQRQTSPQVVRSGFYDRLDGRARA